MNMKKQLELDCSRSYWNLFGR